MNKPDYTALDAAIIKRLNGGAKTFTAMSGIKEAKALEMAQLPTHGSFGKPAFRFIDTRLQALRKKGVIAYDRKTGWSLV